MNKNLLYAFLGGALVGASVALLYAPAKGEDLRERIADLCRKYGLTRGNKNREEVEEIIEQIAAEIEG